MGAQERTEGARPWLRGTVEDATAGLEADREAVGQRDIGGPGHCRGLLRRCRQPLISRRREDGVEPHHAFEGEARRHGPAIAAGRLTDGVVEQPGVDQVEPRPVVHARDGASVAAPHEALEERAMLALCAPR